MQAISNIINTSLSLTIQNVYIVYKQNLKNTHTAVTTLNISEKNSTLSENTASGNNPAYNMCAVHLKCILI